MNEKEICKRLVVILDAYEGGAALISNQGQALDGYSALANFVSVAEDARPLTNAMHSDGESRCACGKPLGVICPKCQRLCDTLAHRR